MPSFRSGELPGLKRGDIPRHLSNLRELDFSGDLLQDHLAGPWFRLGARTSETKRRRQDVEDVIERQSLLVGPREFFAVFDKLQFVGNVLHGLGRPGGSTRMTGGRTEYRYFPFHQFDLPFVSVVGEPVVFLHSDNSRTRLFLNPDLLLFFELESKTAGEEGVWWDPRRGVDALVRRVIDDGRTETVEIRVEYLRKYLQARQMSLLVGHYRDLLLFNPSERDVEAFVKEDLTLGSARQGAKAILQNWGLRKDVGKTPFLQRRLHFWFEIKCAPIDVEDPWRERPSFNIYTFTLPTRQGVVAPARWKHTGVKEGRRFKGAECDFMETVYFRQEVLSKYEGSSMFQFKDDGSISCSGYWGLSRSTFRVGNELLGTAIGDFAEGVPFEEWPHWKQYAVEPPSPQIGEALAQETPVPQAVTSLIEVFQRLNTAFACMAGSLRVGLPNPLWRGELDSLAVRQLKWVYPATAHDDEFLKRATLLSTLFLDGLQPPSLRTFLRAVDETLHQSFDTPQRALGSRNLLQRVALIARLLVDFSPQLKDIPTLVKQAENKAQNSHVDLQAELEAVSISVRNGFAPLAFLYDLRTHGGLAHSPNRTEASAAAMKLGLPEGRWHRKDYLQLVKLVAFSVQEISQQFEAVSSRDT